MATGTRAELLAVKCRIKEIEIHRGPRVLLKGSTDPQRGEQRSQ